MDVFRFEKKILGIESSWEFYVSVWLGFYYKFSLLISYIFIGMVFHRFVVLSKQKQVKHFRMEVIEPQEWHAVHPMVEWQNILMLLTRSICIASSPGTRSCNRHTYYSVGMNIQAPFDLWFGKKREAGSISNNCDWPQTKMVQKIFEGIVLFDPADPKRFICTCPSASHFSHDTNQRCRHFKFFWINIITINRYQYQ